MVAAVQDISRPAFISACGDGASNNRKGKLITGLVNINNKSVGHPQKGVRQRFNSAEIPASPGPGLTVEAGDPTLSAMQQVCKERTSLADNQRQDSQFIADPPVNYPGVTRAHDNAHPSQFPVKAGQTSETAAKPVVSLKTEMQFRTEKINDGWAVFSCLLGDESKAGQVGNLLKNASRESWARKDFEHLLISLSATGVRDELKHLANKLADKAIKYGFGPDSPMGISSENLKDYKKIQQLKDLIAQATSELCLGKMAQDTKLEIFDWLKTNEVDIKGLQADDIFTRAIYNLENMSAQWESSPCTFLHLGLCNLFIIQLLSLVKDIAAQAEPTPDSAHPANKPSAEGDTSGMAPPQMPNHGSTTKVYNDNRRYDNRRYDNRIFDYREYDNRHYPPYSGLTGPAPRTGTLTRAEATGTETSAHDGEMAVVEQTPLVRENVLFASLRRQTPQSWLAPDKQSVAASGTLDNIFSDSRPSQDDSGISDIDSGSEEGGSGTASPADDVKMDVVEQPPLVRENVLFASMRRQSLSSAEGADKHQRSPSDTGYKEGDGSAHEHDQRLMPQETGTANMVIGRHPMLGSSRPTSTSSVTSAKRPVTAFSHYIGGPGSSTALGNRLVSSRTLSGSRTSLMSNTSGSGSSRASLDRQVSVSSTVTTDSVFISDTPPRHNMSTGRDTEE